ncbi:hypothetical protein C5167_004203 [Papaver somniferum]|nr:hypothetical protein C5167_004203 [Papaver somniferum]
MFPTQKVTFFCFSCTTQNVNSKLTSESSKANFSFHVNLLLCMQIQAMEAIYGENFIVLDRQDGLRSFQWLDAMRISSLCKMLDTIWTDQSGQEIVYPWADWIQNSSLSYLEFGNRIPLTASFGKVDNAGDRRAISESVSPDVDTRTRFVKLPCKHFFCRNCMVTYSTMQAKEGGAILCPQIKCSELVPPGLIKSLLGDETFEQWESLLFHKTLDSMSDIVYCPRCDMACLEDEDHLAQCTECFFTFCSRCRDKLHVGVPCMTLEEKLEFLQNRQPAQSGQPIMTKQQLKELDRIRINVYVNEQEIKRIAKKCPNCSMAIFK